MSTSLTQVGSNYYLYNSGAGPQLKYCGTAVVAGQISGWAPIAAEQISGGYQVVWKANGADQYTLWTTDSSGKFVSYIPAMSGSSSVLKSAETTFQQDLNGDGLIGIPTVVIELSGSTSLTQVGSNYYLYNSGAGPQLKYGGTAVVAGQISGWAPIAGRTNLGRLSGRLEGERRRSIYALDHRQQRQLRFIHSRDVRIQFGAEIRRDDLPAGSEWRWPDRRSPPS